MSTVKFDRMNNELILITDDNRQIMAIIDESEAALYTNNILNWIDDAINPTGLVGYVVKSITTLGSDIVSPRELKEELLRVTYMDDRDLGLLCWDAVHDLDNDWDSDLPVYYQAIDCVMNHLLNAGIIKPCCYYMTDKVVGYHIEMAGRIISEAIYGTEPEVTIVS